MRDVANIFDILKLDFIPRLIKAYTEKNWIAYLKTSIDTFYLSYRLLVQKILLFIIQHVKP